MRNGPTLYHIPSSYTLVVSLRKISQCCITITAPNPLWHVVVTIARTCIDLKTNHCAFIYIVSRYSLCVYNCFTIWSRSSTDDIPFYFYIVFPIFTWRWCLSKYLVLLLLKYSSLIRGPFSWLYIIFSNCILTFFVRHDWHWLL